MGMMSWIYQDPGNGISLAITTSDNNVVVVKV